MTDIGFESPTISSPEREKLAEFSLNIEIGNLPFIFKGSIPEKPAAFSFSIHVPNWQQEKTMIDKYVKDNGFFRSIELGSFVDNNGEVAYVDVTQSEIADLYIQKIKSSAGIFPPGSRYHEAEGLGRFLMNNLLTLADIKKWSVTAFPYADGRLTNDDVRDWLLRKNFAYNEKKGYELIREPQPSPDMTQVIATVLKKDNPSKV
jgi:hypothetical protein